MGVLKLFVVLITLIVLCMDTSHAIEPGGMPVPDYAGWDSQRQGFFEVAVFMVKVGVNQYYKLHGHWPESWQSVRNEGIFQVNLRGPGGEHISPDDGDCEFIGDVTYSRDTDGSKATMMYLDWLGKPIFHTFDSSNAPGTYSALASQLDAHWSTDWFSNQFADLSNARSYALTGMLYRCLFFHKTVKGDYPATWEEFVTSGLAPIDLTHSLFPRTLQRITGDGGPGGLLYQYHQTGQSTSFSLTLLDATGTREPYGFSL